MMSLPSAVEVSGKKDMQKLLFRNHTCKFKMLSQTHII